MQSTSNSDAPYVMRDEVSISVQGLSLQYKTRMQNKTFQSSLRASTRKKPRTVDALSSIDLEVKTGTVLGVIGTNGAGKSTLMRCISGIVPPTQGKVYVRGEVSTLLSLGVGFNANLTGRENVMLGGLAAGLSREQIEARFEDICEFAGLGDFIDFPMRTYSSGMYGRLAFAVSTSLDPDILIIDEALSTGDARFKEKSGKRIKELCEQSSTMIIVSHSLATIQELCSEVAWLDQGSLAAIGDPTEIIDKYKKFLKVGSLSALMEDF